MNREEWVRVVTVVRQCWPVMKLDDATAEAWFEVASHWDQTFTLAGVVALAEAQGPPPALADLRRAREDAAVRFNASESARRLAEREAESAEERAAADERRRWWNRVIAATLGGFDHVDPEIKQRVKDYLAAHVGTTHDDFIARRRSGSQRAPSFGDLELDGIMSDLRGMLPPDDVLPAPSPSSTLPGASPNRAERRAAARRGGPRPPSEPEPIGDVLAEWGLGG